MGRARERERERVHVHAWMAAGVYDVLNEVQSVTLTGLHS